MLNFFKINFLLGGFTTLGIGIFVYARNRRNIANITWFLLSICASWWSFGFYRLITSKTLSESLFWRWFMENGSTLIPAFWLHFVLAFLNLNKKRKLEIILGYLLSLFLIILNGTELFYGAMVKRFEFEFYPSGGLGYFLFFFIFFSIYIYSLFQLVHAYFKNRKVSGFKSNQILYIIIGSLLGFMGGGMTFLLTLNFVIIPFGVLFFSIYPIIIAYAIVRYRLMDISLVITRTGIFIVVYSVVLGIPFALAGWFKHYLSAVLGANWWFFPLGTMGVLATGGPFLYIYLERKAEARLLREQKRYQSTLKQASIGMTRIRNLRRLLDLITRIVTKTVKITYAAIYLYNAETNEFLLQVSRGSKKTDVFKLAVDNYLVSWLTIKREPLVYEEVKRQMQDSNDNSYRLLEDNMRFMNSSVVIPSYIGDKFLGFIVLGDKISGQVYTPEDLNVFQVLASQAALAIENAQSYEETKEMQERVAQAEKMATIGTMADGLSHQINNRFYALALIAGDTMDTVKRMDTSQCTPEVKEMLEEVKHAFERIERNVMQGGEVVKGLLKYTRGSEQGGFEPLTLDQILDATLEMVQYKVKLSYLDILRNYAKDLPKMRGNLVQLEEVFFNFIDNAYDAIVERETTLKEPDYKGKIIFSAHPVNGNMEIVIEDNGMGIKDADSKKLFTPFFTTKISSRKGTGLGLYVIKKILTESHQGKIRLESNYGQGTKFTITIPLFQEVNNVVEK